MRRGLVLAVVLGGACFVASWVWRDSQTMVEAADSKTPPQQPAEKARLNVPPKDGKLRIICYGAHSDDCELKVSGCVSATNAGRDREALSFFGDNQN